eukprot:CAMPEP_0194549330 /NCGR_PEP_ID=MMETSP0253-20130528/95058_1 /TAXON_ID=2966 /ORGANISM="Noctiluca scintillans" /LENGTH=303 /DNA_ID=CAMNT_0039396749 /DNA_START=83 /DNA_END=990 /DNA_ORIENTATION=-
MPPLKCVLAWLACFSAGATSVKKWRVLGPFPIGKNELDGEPWHLSNVSELVGGGYASWKRFASREDVLVVDWQDVDWQGLIQGTGGHEVLEWQALALGSFAVPEHSQVSVSCQGVSAFRIDDRQMPFVGDQYRVGLPGYSVNLKRGNHRISIRLRAKHRAVVRCEVESVQLGPYRPQLYAGDSVTVPDVYEGFLAGGLVGLPVLNVHPTEWLRDVRAVVTGGGFNASLSSVATLAPNQRLRLPLRVDLTERGCPKGLFRVAVEGKLGGEVLRSTPLAVSLRCREQGQSFVFTFLDADGSVQQA